MFEESRSRKSSSTWTWPVGVAVVVLSLAGIQFFRVNRPRDVAPAEIQKTYTQAGVLISRNLVLPARDFYSQQIDLNRPSELAGSFRTPSTSQRVGVLVLSQANFEAWRTGAEFQSLARTGYIPGGKINLRLSPGTFFLVIDNRENDTEQRVYADFGLDR